MAPDWYRSDRFRGIPHQEELELQLIRSNPGTHQQSFAHRAPRPTRNPIESSDFRLLRLGLLGFNPEIPCRFPRAGPPCSSRSSHISLFSLRTIQSELYRAANRPTTGKVRVSSTCFLPAREPASARDAGVPRNNSSSEVSVSAVRPVFTGGAPHGEGASRRQG